MNHRSVVVLGRAQLRRLDNAERMNALRILTNHIVPNRREEVREPNRAGDAADFQYSRCRTGRSASAKIRVGELKDDEEDRAPPVWGGIVPILTQVGRPIDDGRVRAGRGHRICRGSSGRQRRRPDATWPDPTSPAAARA